MSDDKFRYNLLWKCVPKPDGVTVDEVPEGWGACTAMVFLSIIREPDGGLSTNFFPIDGEVASDEGEPVSDSLDYDEVFKAWLMMAEALGRRPELSNAKRGFCKAIVDSYVEFSGIGCDCGDPRCVFGGGGHGRGD